MLSLYSSMWWLAALTWVRFSEFFCIQYQTLIKNACWSEHLQSAITAVWRAEAHVNPDERAMGLTPVHQSQRRKTEEEMKVNRKKEIATNKQLWLLCYTKECGKSQKSSIIWGGPIMVHPSSPLCKNWYVRIKYKINQPFMINQFNQMFVFGFPRH